MVIIDSSLNVDKKVRFRLLSILLVCGWWVLICPLCS